jgi:cytoskeleton protein RodZ
MNEIDDTTGGGAPGETGVNPGTRLAQAREALKLSAADVARQLKLSVGQVEALEAGQFERLPGAVFVRGFIRNYARLVKLNPDELLVAAGNILPQQAPRPETPPSQDIPFPSARPRRWQKYAWAVSVLVVAIAFYEFFVSSEEMVVTTHPVDVVPAPPVAPEPKDEIAPAPLTVTPASESASNSAAAATASDAATVEPAPPAKPVAAAPAARRAPPPAPEPATPAPDAGAALASDKPAERQVTLEFEDESWVEIRDRDGKVILWQLNLPGTRQVLSGRPPLSFVIGNAHGVRLTYGDRPVDLAPYTRTDVARMTLE